MYTESELREQTKAGLVFGISTKSELREQTKATECVFGLVGDGFAIVAADASTGYRFIGPGATTDKIMVFDSHKLVGAIGNCGDRQMFTKRIKRQARPFKGTRLTTADTATFIHDELAATVHRFKRVSMLLVGYDKETGPSLYHIDCTASLNKVEKGAFGGDGSSYSLSAMDSFHSGMSQDKAIELVDACIEEIRSSLDVKSANHIIKIVDEQGARHYAWRKFIATGSGAIHTESIFEKGYNDQLTTSEGLQLAQKTMHKAATHDVRTSGIVTVQHVGRYLTSKLWQGDILKHFSEIPIPMEIDEDKDEGPVPMDE